jgi:FkbM family methyltransferase
MTNRSRLVQKLIHINEAIFFYPKLKNFYKTHLNQNRINIIDVGANKGQSIDFFLKINKNATINSFEPNKKLFHLLQNKYKTNTNITIHNLGLSNVKGELIFHENVMDETSSFEELNFESKYLEKKAKVLGVAKENIIVDNYKVEVIRLSDFLKDNTNIGFDVLKIDVEGHELQCLQGLFQEESGVLPIRFIQLESHNDDMYLNNNQHQEIENILFKNDFEKCITIKHGFGDFAEIIYENKGK